MLAASSDSAWAVMFSVRGGWHRSRPAAGGYRLRSEPLRRGCRGLSRLPVPHERTLLKGQDYALIDVAAFELAVRVGGLLHGHGFVRAQAEPAIG